MSEARRAPSIESASAATPATPGPGAVIAFPGARRAQPAPAQRSPSPEALAPEASSSDGDSAGAGASASVTLASFTRATALNAPAERSTIAVAAVLSIALALAGLVVSLSLTDSIPLSGDTAERVTTKRIDARPSWRNGWGVPARVEKRDAAPPLAAEAPVRIKQRAPAAKKPEPRVVAAPSQSQSASASSERTVGTQFLRVLTDESGQPR